MKGSDYMDELWESLPLYLNYKEIMKLGFKKDTIYKWFNSESFPEMLHIGGMRVNKFKFREWLEKQEMKTHED